MAQVKVSIERRVPMEAGGHYVSAFVETESGNSSATFHVDLPEDATDEQIIDYIANLYG